MPQKTNCSQVHPDRIPGPCACCGMNDVSKRYIHPVQKLQNYEYYLFLKEIEQIADDSCICRKCEARMNVKFRSHDLKNTSVSDDHAVDTKNDGPPPSKRLSVENDFQFSVSDSNSNDDSFSGNSNSESINSECFLSQFNLCNQTGQHHTTINVNNVSDCFQLRLTDIYSEDCLLHAHFCHSHYNKLNRFLQDVDRIKSCCICEKFFTGRERIISISNDKQDTFTTYCRDELLSSNNSSLSKTGLCISCYKSFNLFCRSENASLVKANTDSFLLDCFQKSLIPELKLENITFNQIDSFCFQKVSKALFDKFLNYIPVMLPALYTSYKKLVDDTVCSCAFFFSDTELKRLYHSPEWLFKMLKTTFGPCLLCYSPSRRNSGRLLYRLGTDLLKCIHSLILNYEKQLEDINSTNKCLNAKIDQLISSKSFSDVQSFDNVVSKLRDSVKSYALAKANLTSFDIRSFNLIAEITKINPVLWNFIYRLTTTDAEEKELKKHLFQWDLHYIPTVDVNKVFPISRLFHRLFIDSCLFNTQNSQCFLPLHLLVTDLADKFSNSSTAFLTINARIGAGISKETLQRFITNKCIELEKANFLASSDSFMLASFDNLDKNQSYSVVSSGKERSGFHGTTLQAVAPLPESEKIELNDFVSENSSCSISTNISIDSPCNSGSRLRKFPSQLVESICEPEDKIGVPSDHKVNRFSHLQPPDFTITEEELCSWNELVSTVNAYSFTKVFAQKKHILLPELKYFLSLSDSQTEKSSFYYMAILDETADNKETVLKVLNIFHQKFQIGSRVNYLVVVGDGKSYDHLIKLKIEYGEVLNWVLPYPGDWHILKNLQPVLIKIYFDAGLKELATKFHKGATLRVLMDSGKFQVVHRFLLQAWEAFFRYQIQLFLERKQIFSDFAFCFSSVFDSIDEPLNETVVCDQQVWEHIASKLQELQNCLSGCNAEFNTWRGEQSLSNETFLFWDRFVHQDMTAYIAFYLSIRSRNWLLRNVSLKKLCCLFYAFDRHNYLRMIPHHFADLSCFPQPVIDHFMAGGFSVSITGKNFYCVAADEAHEMEINLKTKTAMNSFSKTSLSELAFYLPYRARVLDDLKKELHLDTDDNHHYRESTVNYVTNAEETISAYIEMLENSTLFSNSEQSLHHIFTKTVANVEQRDSLLNFRQYGEEDMMNYIKCVLLHVSFSDSKMPRKRRNLKTFSAQKVTVQHKNREIKDQKTVISCLRKKIAFSKITGQPVLDLEQFIKLPRAISNADGIPEKGQKSSFTQVLRSIYKDAFMNNVPKLDDDFTAVIIDEMFMINTSPVSLQSNFCDYSKFLFDRWVLRAQLQFNASEIHVIFDDPQRHGLGPKDIERCRRDADKVLQIESIETITDTTHLPSNWQAFLGVRNQKRKLINYLSYKFLDFAAQNTDRNFIFVTAGGFDGEYKDRAMCSVGDTFVEYALASPSDHEEADSRVWLHAFVSSSTRIIIYSPDTDTYCIGLPLISSFSGKSVFIHLKDTPYEKLFVNLNTLVSLIEHDILLQGIASITHVLQMLYIVSGCDYVSFFRGFGKRTFVDVFRKNSLFICSLGSTLADTESESGLLSFFRLIATLYFSRHRAAFLPTSTTEILFNSLQAEGSVEKHLLLLNNVRDKMWERVLTEDEIMPNPDALKLHWKRCCWVFNMWSQATCTHVFLPQLTNFGWSLSDDNIEAVWDIKQNFEKVESTVQWYTKGCACKSGCLTNRCKCRRDRKDLMEDSLGRYCGPGCKCINCKNVQFISDLNQNTETADNIHDVDEEEIQDFSVFQELNTDNFFSADTVYEFEEVDFEDYSCRLEAD